MNHPYRAHEGREGLDIFANGIYPKLLSNLSLCFILGLLDGSGKGGRDDGDKPKNGILIVNHFMGASDRQQHTVPWPDFNFLLIDPDPAFSGEEEKNLFLILVNVRITGLMGLDLIRRQPDVLRSQRPGCSQWLDGPRIGLGEYISFGLFLGDVLNQFHDLLSVDKM